MKNLAVTPVLSADALAIAKSVIYASLFEYPLTLAQLHTALVDSAQSPADILTTYRTSLPLQRVVEYRDGYFYPAGRRDFVAIRREREARSRAFLRKHRTLLTLVCALPFTRMVALSGSIAHLNLAEGGDLDLFIVTRGERVWSVTVAVLVLAKLLRRRQVTCANFVVADTDVRLDQPDLFTANQVVHLRPLVGGSFLRAFVEANAFVGEFYPNYRPTSADADMPASSAAAQRFKRATEWLLAGPSLAVEAVCRRAYGWHLRRRASTWRSPSQVQLGRDRLKLHTRSHRVSTLDRFDEALAHALAEVDVELSTAAPVSAGWRTTPIGPSPPPGRRAR